MVEVKAPGVSELGLLTHSGSRGIGNKLAHYYADLAERQTKAYYKVPTGYGWLNIYTDLGQEYLAVLDLMGRYAAANHQVIHNKFQALVGAESLSVVDNRHNFAWVEANGIVTHRKGATPAGEGRYGVIPGSSGSNSYVVKGKGNDLSLNSASHGAGRPRSRSASKILYEHEVFLGHMRARGITHHGVASDETVAAYKSIESVMAAQTDLVNIVATLEPRVVVMGGGSKQDDGD